MNKVETFAFLCAVESIPSQAASTSWTTGTDTGSDADD